MVFADLKYPERYEEKHDGLCTLLMSRFSHVESGLQSDSLDLGTFWRGEGCGRHIHLHDPPK